MLFDSINLTATVLESLERRVVYNNKSLVRHLELKLKDTFGERGAKRVIDMYTLVYPHIKFILVYVSIKSAMQSCNVILL